jgi:hypothetical protein
MRAFLICLAFLGAQVLHAQAILTVNPAQPRVDAVTTFTINGVVPFSVNWDFGDGTPIAAGGAVATHTYTTSGSFIVRASYTLSTTSGAYTTVQRPVAVTELRRIRFSPAAPQPGQPVVLQAQSFFGTMGLTWSFGDDTASYISDATQAVHTYAKPGLYTVTALDSGAANHPIRVKVLVGPTGPSAPFAISYLALRWEDGTLRRTVVQGEGGLTAYADLKFEGTGLFQAQWMVDGVVFRSFSRQLNFANRATLTSGQAAPGGPQLSLPTNIPGEHTVTLQVLQPGLTFEVPVIRYFVSLGPDPDGPVLKNVVPKRVRSGEEVELQLSGPRLAPDMELHLGRDMAVVGPIRLVGPEVALVNVFVAPTARPGIRVLKSSKEKGAPAGSARLEILPPVKKSSNRK